MLEEHIFHICNCDSLFSLADNLESFLHYLDSTKNKKKALQALFQQINVHNFYSEFEEHSSCRIYNAKASVLKYLTNYWQYNSAANKDVERLCSIIKQIRESFVNMERHLMAAEMINNLFALADEKYNFTNRVLSEKKVDVLLIENTHKEWNSFYSAVVNPGEEVLYDSIILSSIPFNSISSQEFCFMHELGHLLHTRITMKIEKAPKSFEQLLTTMHPSSNHISDSTNVELFANCFAGAVLYDTEYGSHDMLKMDGSIIGALDDYMLALIRKSFLIKEARYA